MQVKWAAAADPAARPDDNANANRTVVVTGPGGSAWTPDEGNTWFTLPGVTGCWGVAFGSPKVGWLVGTGGQIQRIEFSGERRP